MAIKLTDLSKVKIERAGRVLGLTFECGQTVKVSPDGLIAFAERAIRQAEAAKDFALDQPKSDLSFAVMSKREGHVR